MIVNSVPSPTCRTAVMLTGTAETCARSDPVTQHGSESGNCARSAFRVLIDVGHTASSPGANSAHGMTECEFNLKVADVIAQSLHGASFDKTIRLVTSGSRLRSLFQRAASANSLQGDLFISIHHDFVPANLKETRQYEGKKLANSDRFTATLSSFPMIMQIVPQACVRPLARSRIAEARPKL